MIVARGLGFGGGSIIARGYGFDVRGRPIIGRRGSIFARLQILSLMNTKVLEMEAIEANIQADQIASTVELIGGNITQVVQNSGGTVKMSIEVDSISASIEV